MPPCHRHMVIATSFSSLFELLQCSIPQMRAECCLEITAVDGHRTFPGLSGAALPLPWGPLGAPRGGHPQFPGIKRESNGSMAHRPGPRSPRPVVCVHGVLPEHSRPAGQPAACPPSRYVRRAGVRFILPSPVFAMT